LLRRLAQSLVSNTRGTDVSARIGDTDFLLLMSETGIEGGIKGIRRVNDLLMQIIEEYELPVSFSIGLVTYNILPESIDQMISQADTLKDESRRPGSDHIQHQVVDL
jgi:diguanylate cyclase (GGDEF)-like protein